MAIVGADSNMAMALLGVITAILAMMVIRQTGKLNRYKGDHFIDTYLDCKESGNPLGLIYDKSGKILSFRVESAERNDALVEAPSRWTMFSPDLINSASHSHIPGGPEVCTWVMPYSFPVNINSSAALCQLARTIRGNKTLNKFGNERKIISLVCDNTKAFEYNCAQFMSIYYNKYKSRIPKEYMDEINKIETPKPAQPVVEEPVAQEGEVQFNIAEAIAQNIEEEPKIEEKPKKKGFLAKFRSGE